MFGQTVRFNIGKSKQNFQTSRGSLTSLVILGLILVFGTNKFLTMYQRGDTKFQTKIEQNAIPDEQVFLADDLEFAIAFTLMGYVEGS